MRDCEKTLGTIILRIIFRIRRRETMTTITMTVIKAKTRHRSQKQTGSNTSKLKNRKMATNKSGIHENNDNSSNDDKGKMQKRIRMVEEQDGRET